MLEKWYAKGKKNKIEEIVWGEFKWMGKWKMQEWLEHLRISAIGLMILGDKVEEEGKNEIKKKLYCGWEAEIKRSFV